MAQVDVTIKIKIARYFSDQSLMASTEKSNLHSFERNLKLAFWLKISCTDLDFCLGQKLRPSRRIGHEIISFFLYVYTIAFLGWNPDTY